MSSRPATPQEHLNQYSPEKGDWWGYISFLSLLVGIPFGLYVVFASPSWAGEHPTGGGWFIVLMSLLGAFRLLPYWSDFFGLPSMYRWWCRSVVGYAAQVHVCGHDGQVKVAVFLNGNSALKEFPCTCQKSDSVAFTKILGGWLLGRINRVFTCNYYGEGLRIRRLSASAIELSRGGRVSLPLKEATRFVFEYRGGSVRNIVNQACLNEMLRRDEIAMRWAEVQFCERIIEEAARRIGATSRFVRSKEGAGIRTWLESQMASLKSLSGMDHVTRIQALKERSTALTQVQPEPTPSQT